MSENQLKHNESEEIQEQESSETSNGNGGKLRKPDNWFLVLFIAILAVPYIWYAHRTDKKIRELDKLNKEVKELRSEYVTLKSEIVSKNKQSDIVQKLGEHKIKPLESAPYIIKKEKK